MLLYLHPSIHLRLKVWATNPKPTMVKSSKCLTTRWTCFMNLFRSRQQLSIRNSWRNTMSWISGESITGQVNSGHWLEKRGRVQKNSIHVFFHISTWSTYVWHKKHIKSLAFGRPARRPPSPGLDQVDTNNRSYFFFSSQILNYIQCFEWVCSSNSLVCVHQSIYLSIYCYLSLFLNKRLLLLPLANESTYIHSHLWICISIYYL